ncbi:MAG: DNA polymerase III subunit gamma/tau, partial [Chloroflexota bacterium]
MTRQALYLKWRPHTFDDVIGQEHITRTLRNSMDSGRIRHAYLFSGPRGTGKTTTARLLAHALGCNNLDLIEIDAASHTGVDDVRDLRDKIAFMPTEGQYKTYIIDEVHRFSGSAFDALLKTLEEPPEHAIFVLATTEIDKVPDTIKSRCLMFEFRRVAMTEVADRLQSIAESEGINVDRDALELIARQGTGSVRDSISLLDQIVADPEEHITLAITERILGTAKSETVLGLAEAVLKADTVNGLHIINRAVDSGSDPKQFGQQVVEHLRGVLLAQTSSADLIEASDEMRQIYTEQAAMVNKSTLLRAVRAFSEAVADQRGGWHPQLALELALVESTHERAG